MEIGVMPVLKDADGMTLALNAPSRTFDLSANAFDDDFFSPIVKVADGCNNCHDALVTTFHSPDRGGNIVVCRLCHTTKTGGSHLSADRPGWDSCHQRPMHRDSVPDYWQQHERFGVHY